MKTLLFALSLVLLPCSSYASLIQYVGPVSNANDGQFFTGPSNLLIDGKPVVAVCISFDITVASTWQGEVEALSAVQPPSAEIPYLEAAWLFQEFFVSPQSDWAGIQHAIWDHFGASYTDPGALSFSALADANYGFIDPSRVTLIIPDQKRASQTFLMVGDAPEPGTYMLFASGLGLIVLALKRKR